jgi:c-di-GMP-binding flagellar brake protein YcgR
MLQDILTIGDKIDIKHLDRFGRPAHNAKTFVSQLIDFVDFDVIHIAAPITSSTPIILNVGEGYKLCFYTNKGLYQCNCVILSNRRENNIIVAVVRITSNLEKYQRRQYYRLECIIDMEYRVITSEEELLEKKFQMEDFASGDERTQYRKILTRLQNEWVLASITDISGGGARFNSEVLHNHGDKLQIKLDLRLGSELRKMVLGAIVISSGSIENRTGVYEHRVEFNNIMKKDREDLIKYIFEQERRRRKNEKN